MSARYAPGTIPLRYARELLARVPGDPRGLLSECGVPPGALEDERHRLTGAQLAALSRCVVSAYDDELYGYFARAVPRGTFATLVHIATGCRSVRAFIEAGLHLYALFDGGHPHLSLEVDSKVATITVSPRSRAQRDALFFAHAALLTTVRTAVWLAQSTFTVRQVTLPRRFVEFTSHARFLFGVVPRLVEEDYSISFDARVLAWPVRRQCAEVAHWVRRASFGALIERSPRDSIESRLRAALAATEPFAKATLPEAARRLGISYQVLARRLRALGVSFQQIKDEVRLDHAVALLSKGVPIVEISTTLGFSDPSAFSRAFKMWTGAAPTRYSRRAGAS